MTVADLEARIGPIDAAEHDRAQALIGDALALAKSVHGRRFGVVDGDTRVLRVRAGKVLLPDPPVSEVSAVVAMGVTATEHKTLTEGTDWTFDWIDTITLHACADVVKVTYSHGRPPPDVLVAQVATMVNRVLLSPSKVDGIVQESMGQVSYQLQQGMGTNGTGVRMFPSDEAVFKRLRRTRSRSIPVVRG